MCDDFHLKEPNTMILFSWTQEGFEKMDTVKVSNSMLHESGSGFLEDKIPYLFIREPVNKSNTHLFLISPSYKNLL